jgi:hypothetical protein
VLCQPGAGPAIACTVIDSAAAASCRGIAEPADLAALARELSANDWQVRELITPDGGAAAGTATDRNVVLAIDWPGAAGQAQLS